MMEAHRPFQRVLPLMVEKVTLNDVWSGEDLDAARTFIVASGAGSHVMKFNIAQPVDKSGSLKRLCSGLVALLEHLPSLELLRLSMCIGEGQKPILNIDEALMALQWPTDDDATTTQADNQCRLRSMKICPKLEGFETHAMVMDSTLLRIMLESRIRDPNIPARPGLPWQLEYARVGNPTLTDDPEVLQQEGMGARDQLPWLVEMEEKGWCRSHREKERVFSRDIQPMPA
ncbi:hypothetical protein BDV98DRAFT_569693 [Pterulicium gracile]|uniref:Uncharacterized protein n=1 Tax=Pterulicium gracile TaxID=1884261 RepID=A0A5C3QFV6_9AGAR|nr:hypothetical protein BDV98DRAFT_569693 [Pterula gracilis]